MQITHTHAENTLYIYIYIYIYIYVTTYEFLGCECVQFTLYNKMSKYSYISVNDIKVPREPFEILGSICSLIALAELDVIH